MAKSKKRKTYEGVILLIDLVDFAVDLDEVADRMEGCAATLRKMHRDGLNLVEDASPTVLRVSAPNEDLAGKWYMDDDPNTIIGC